MYNSPYRPPRNPQKRKEKMDEARALGLAQTIREVHRQLVDRAGRGEVISSGDLTQNGRRIDDLVDRLSEHEGVIDECSEMLAHRINNLLMAVQMAHDFLSTKENARGTDEIRQRLRDTIAMGSLALAQVRETLTRLV
jgi:hypothetical protein